MTVNAITPEQVVDLDGTQNSIPFDFALADADELAIERDGVLLTRTVDYNVIAPVAENDGEVTLIPPLVAGRYVLVRQTDDDQVLQLSAQQKFPSSLIGATFDKVVRLIQELRAKVSRAILQSLQDPTKVDARSLRIGQLADPVDDQDAVTKSHMEARYLTLPPGGEGPPGPAIPGPPGTGGPAGQPLIQLFGANVPNANLGITGQTYLNTSNGDLYQRADSGWLLVANLKGPPGSGGGGVTDHGALTGLGDPDHPIAAVSGLQDALDDITNSIALTQGSQILVFRQPAEPTGPIPTGSLWFKTDESNRLYMFDGVDWIDVRDSQIDANSAALSSAIADIATAQATADGKIVSYVAATAPAGASVGDLWLRTTDNRLHRYSGSAWVAFVDADITAALTDAAAAQATADGKIVSYYQPTAPLNGISHVGDLWIDTDDNNHPHRFNGSTWVSIRDATIALVASGLADAVDSIAGVEAMLDGVVNIYYQASAPTTGSNPELSTGDLWIDSDDNQTYRWNGSSFVSIQDSGVAQAVTDASNAVAVADQKVRIFYQNAAPNPGSQQVDTGDLWIDLDDNNRRYRYNGSAWVAVSAIVDTDELADGAVTVDKLSVTQLSAITANMGAITAGTISLNALGFIRAGMTAWDVGAGFWLGYTGGAYKLAIGNVNNALIWDGTKLFIRGGTYSGSGLFPEDVTRSGNGGVSSSVSFSVTRGQFPKSFSYKFGGGFPQTNDHQWLFGGDPDNYEAKFVRSSGPAYFTSPLDDDTWYDVAGLADADYWQFAGSGTLVGTLTFRHKTNTDVTASRTIQLTIT